MKKVSSTFSKVAVSRGRASGRASQGAKFPKSRAHHTSQKSFVYSEIFLKAESKTERGF